MSLGEEGQGRFVLAFSSVGVVNPVQEGDEAAVACEWSVWKGFLEELECQTFLK